MGRPIVPRGLVVMLAALVIGVPAAFVLASDYRYDGQSHVIHHHTDDYTLYNQVNGDTTLKSKVDLAQQTWDDAGSSRGTVRVSSVSSGDGAQIVVKDQNLGDNNQKVSFVDADANGRAIATFNSYQSYYGMNGSEKRGRACRVIGNIMGLENAESSRNDCMSAPATYDTPSATSKDLIDSYYGPNLQVSGSMKQAMNAQWSLDADETYELTAEASGHAMARVQILDETDNVLASSSPVQSTQCADKCTRTATLTANGSDLAFQLGDPNSWHTLRIVAENEFGLLGGTKPADYADEYLGVFVLDTSIPETEIDSGPAGRTSNPRPSFAFHSTEENSTFQCRFNSDSWSNCNSGTFQSVDNLSEGLHTFEVKATDPFGNVDPTPAVRGFTMRPFTEVELTKINALLEKGGTATLPELSDPLADPWYVDEHSLPSSSEMHQELEDLRRRAGWLPRLATVGKLVLGGVGSYIAWEVGGEVLGLLVDDGGHDDPVGNQIAPVEVRFVDKGDVLVSFSPAHWQPEQIVLKAPAPGRVYEYPFSFHQSMTDDPATPFREPECNGQWNAPGYDWILPERAVWLQKEKINLESDICQRAGLRVAFDPITPGEFAPGYLPTGTQSGTITTAPTYDPLPPTSVSEANERLDELLATGDFPSAEEYFDYLLDTDAGDPRDQERDSLCDLSPPAVPEPNDDPYAVHDTFSSNDGQGGIRATYMRWGFEQRWGYRKAITKHGWSGVDIAETAAALNAPPSPQDTTLVYTGMTYSGANGALCARRVVVQTAPVEDVDPPGKAKEIISSYGRFIGWG